MIRLPHWEEPSFQEWLRSDAIPFLGAQGELCPNTRGSYRKDIEGGFPRGPNTTADEVLFNYVMCLNTAAFADIIGEYTKHLYGFERHVAIFKILAMAWQSFADGSTAFGLRGWMRRICEQAVPARSWL